MQSFCKVTTESKPDSRITAEFSCSIKRPQVCHTMYLSVQKQEQSKEIKSKPSVIKIPGSNSVSTIYHPCEIAQIL